MQFGMTTGIVTDFKEMAVKLSAAAEIGTHYFAQPLPLYVNATCLRSDHRIPKQALFHRFLSFTFPSCPFCFHPKCVHPVLSSKIIHPKALRFQE